MTHLEKQFLLEAIEDDLCNASKSWYKNTGHYNKIKDLLFSILKEDVSLIQYIGKHSLFEIVESDMEYFKNIIAERWKNVSDM